MWTANVGHLVPLFDKVLCFEIQQLVRFSYLLQIFHFNQIHLQLVVYPWHRLYVVVSCKIADDFALSSQPQHSCASELSLLQSFHYTLHALYSLYTGYSISKFRVKYIPCTVQYSCPLCREKYNLTAFHCPISHCTLYSALPDDNVHVINTSVCKQYTVYIVQ